MSTILFSLLENGLKLVPFTGITRAEIICGKKFRDSRDTKNAGASIKKK